MKTSHFPIAINNNPQHFAFRNPFDSSDVTTQRDQNMLHIRCLLMTFIYCEAFQREKCDGR